MALSDAGKRVRRSLRRLGVAALALTPFLLAPIIHFDLSADGDSVCHGTPGDGWLEGGERPAAFGRNFRPYCWLCVLALRTHGHAEVVATMEDAYAAMAEFRPELRLVYGEIGFPWGGWFYPHRSHQNGLAVDFMTPMTPSADNPGGEPPTWLINRFGYGATLDADGVDAATGARADFDAILQHLGALEANARARGGRIARVIFAPDLQDDLLAAAGGNGSLSQLIPFSVSPAWVRHDDHYHVEFDFPCAAR